MIRATAGTAPPPLVHPVAVPAHHGHEPAARRVTVIMGSVSVPESSRTCAVCGPDVLVEPEDVVRVVVGFDFGQAVVIAAVGVPDPVAAVVAQVVDIHAP